MTEPNQDQDQSEPEPEDAGSLVPILTTIIAAYLAYQATSGPVKGSWRYVATVLGLEEMAGEALLHVVQRALSRQQKGKGLSKQQLDQLWMATDEAVKAGKDAGIQKLVAILKSVGDKTAAATERTATDSTRPAAERTATDSNPPVDPDKTRAIAEDLARTVGHAAQNAAGEAAGLTKRWRSMHDMRVRSSHALLDGDSVPADKPFITDAGIEIRYPHDPAAPLDETINCRCGLTWYTK